MHNARTSMGAEDLLSRTRLELPLDSERAELLVGQQRAKQVVETLGFSGMQQELQRRTEQEDGTLRRALVALGVEVLSAESVGAYKARVVQNSKRHLHELKRKRTFWALFCAANSLLMIVVLLLGRDFGLEGELSLNSYLLIHLTWVAVILGLAYKPMMRLESQRRRFDLGELPQLAPLRWETEVLANYQDEVSPHALELAVTIRNVCPEVTFVVEHTVPDWEHPRPACRVGPAPLLVAQLGGERYYPLRLG